MAKLCHLSVARITITQHASAPYFQGGALEAMPAGNLILENPEHTQFVDFGTPLAGGT
jgi:hypothetical protein